MPRPLVLSCAFFVAGLDASVAAPQHDVRKDATSWPGWGNSARFDRYSPADQINAANVKDLRPVWIVPLKQAGGWEVTPIVVDGVLYTQDMQGTAFALDPESGRELWRFATGQVGRMRAAAWWPGDAAHGPRVIISGNDRIYALDATTGKPAPGFGGAQGYINIRDGFAPKDVNYDITSPPTVYRNLLITGPGTQEFGAKGPPGDPRAYDVITGKLVWRFSTVPHPGERNDGSWGGKAGRTAPGPAAGACIRWMKRPGRFSSRWAIRRTAISAPTGPATISIPTSSSRWMRRRENTAGTTRWCITTCSTMTMPPRPR